MNNDNDRNAGGIWDIHSIGSDYHDVHYIHSSSTNSEESRTKSSTDVAFRDSFWWSRYVYTFFIERANDAFCLSSQGHIFREFYKRTIK